MKVEIELDPVYLEPTFVIRAAELTPELSELIRSLQSTPSSSFLIGYHEERIYLIQPGEIIRIYTDQKKVLVETERDTYLVKLRLYEIEEKYPTPYLVRISNSEIVNMNQVERLDLSLSGTICMIFRNGKRTFVSRRYIADMKKYLNL